MVFKVVIIALNSVEKLKILFLSFIKRALAWLGFNLKTSFTAGCGKWNGCNRSITINFTKACIVDYVAYYLCFSNFT